MHKKLQTLTLIDIHPSQYKLEHSGDRPDTSPNNPHLYSYYFLSTTRASVSLYDGALSSNVSVLMCEVPTGCLESEPLLLVFIALLRSVLLAGNSAGGTCNWLQDNTSNRHDWSWTWVGLGPVRPNWWSGWLPHGPFMVVTGVSCGIKFCKSLNPHACSRFAKGVCVCVFLIWVVFLLICA